MKILEIRTYLMQVGAPPLKAWAADGSFGSHRPEKASSRNWLFVRVVTDAGITGIGECSGWPRVVETAVKDLAGLLIGEDPADIERLCQKMHIAMMGHGLSGVVGWGAVSGIEMALWDIKGKALRTPVWNLLGGRVRDRIRIYSHAGTPEVARSLLERGITAVKVGGVARPVAKVAAIREALGMEVDLMVDLHGPPWLTPADAVRMGRALEPYDLLFLEDPIAPENVEGYRRLREHLAMPLAAGERMAGIWGLRPLIEEELVDVVQPDTGRAGGLLQMRKIAAMAEAHAITVAPHSGSLGPVAEYAALHFLASIPNCLMLERIEDDWPVRHQVIVPALHSVDGHLAVPDAPGLGVDIDESVVASHPSHFNVAVPIEESAGAYEPGTFREHVYYQTRFRRGAWFSPGARPPRTPGEKED
jgi:galactonate dehydratase